jgi:hypothetical protein
MSVRATDDAAATRERRPFAPAQTLELEAIGEQT